MLSEYYGSTMVDDSTMSNDTNTQQQHQPLDDTFTYTLSGHNTPINSVKFNQLNGLIASGDDQGKLFIWDMNNNNNNNDDDNMTNSMNIMNTKHHKSEILDLLWLNESHVLTGSADGTAKIYDIEQNKVIHSVSSSNLGNNTIKDKNTTSINTVACTPHDNNPQLFITAGDNGVVNVWDRRFKNVPIHEIITKNPLCSVKCNNDLTMIYTGGIDDMIHCFDMVNGKKWLSLQGHNDVITSLHLSKDNSILTSYSYDNTIQTWDIRPIVSEQRLQKGRLINKYDYAGGLRQNKRNQQLHRHCLFTIPSLLSPSKQFHGIIGTSADFNCYLWDLHYQQPVSSTSTKNQNTNNAIIIKNHTASVNDVDVYKQWLVTASSDGNVILGAMKL